MAAVRLRASACFGGALLCAGSTSPAALASWNGYAQQQLVRYVDGHNEGA